LKYDIKWEIFKVRNPRYEDSFEEMCRHMFCRELGVSGYDFTSNYNQTGLEMEPVKINGKYYGFQAKFVKGNPYSQIEKSLCNNNKAFDLYRGKLDHIYIYTNASIKPEPTKQELIKFKNGEIKNSPRLRIFERAKKEGIELTWITQANFSVDLNKENNLGIAMFYFGVGKEVRFINDSISGEDTIFLKSEKYLEIPLKNNELGETSIETIVDENRISLIKGDPGTGKSELLKKIFIKYGNPHVLERQTIYSILEKSIIPVFVQLKEVVNGNLEEYMRTYMYDYDLKIYDDNKMRYLYILDGIDEVSYNYANNMALFIKKLYKNLTTYAIVLSSRTNSPNISILKGVVNNITDFYIEKLDASYIDKYFTVQMDDAKELRYAANKKNIIKLVEDIDDIFSVKLLWDNIERVNHKTTKIELVEKSIEILLDDLNVNRLNILDSKQDKLRNLCRKIACHMQRKKRLSINLKTLQELIYSEIKNINNSDVNEIVNCLKVIFFSTTNKDSDDNVFTFKHRRYEEYFLYAEMKLQFCHNPRILRELNLLSNNEFMMEIFMPQMMIDCKRSKDIIGVLSIGFILDYLGRSYWKKEKHELLPNRSDWGSSDPEYQLSEELLYAIASQTTPSLDLLINDRSLPISEYLEDKSRWLKAVEVFHRNNHLKQAEYFISLISSIDKEEQSEEIWNNCSSYVYYRYKILKTPLIDIIKDLPDISDDNSIYGYDSLESPLKSMVRAFYQVVIEFEPMFIINNYNSIPNYHLNVLCDELCSLKNLLNILMDEEFKEGLVKLLLVDNMCDYDISVRIIYAIINKETNIDKQIEEYFNSINDGNIPTWDRRRDINLLISTVFYINDNIVYTEAKNHTFLIQIITENFNKNQVLMLEEILMHIRKIQKTNDFVTSKIIGILIAHLNISIREIKKFFNAITGVKCISVDSVIYYLNNNNTDMFMELCNPSMILRQYNKIKEEGITNYYGSYMETLLRYAKIISVYNFEESYSIIKECVNVGILRPCFRKEIIVNDVLSKCLRIVKENAWYCESELIVFVKRIREMLKLMQDSTDGGGRSGYYNYVLANYYPTLVESYSLDNGYTDYDEISIDNFDKNISEQVCLENLYKYYNGEVDGLDYSSKRLWTGLLTFERERTGTLDVLFKYFKDTHYPYIWGFPNCENHHIPSAILWKDTEWSDKIRDFIMDQGGHSGLFNMIKMSAVIGEDDFGKKCFEQLIRLCELLVF